MLARLLPRLAWLRWARTRHLLIVCGLLVGLALAAGGWLLAVNHRQGDLTDRMHHLQNVSMLLAEETDRLFQAVELVQVSLIDHMREAGIDTPEEFSRRMAGAEIQRDLAERVAGLPQIEALALIDVQGRMTNESLGWPPPAIDVRDRAFFRAITSEHPVPFSIDAPVRNRLNGGLTLIVARAFNVPNGQLIGIVATGLEIAYWQRFMMQLAVEGDASFGLFRNDGVVLARYPRPTGDHAGSEPQQVSLPRSLAASGGRAVVRASAFDGKRRLIAVHDVPHYPLTITVTDSEWSVLHDWRVQTAWLGGLVGLTEIALAGIVVLGIRQLRDQERVAAARAATVRAEAARAVAEAELARAEERARSEHAAREQADRFDIALRNMLQGLIMFDGAGRVQVVNHRFYELSGVPEGLVTPGLAYAELLNLVVHRGTITAADLVALRTWRTEAQGRQTRATFTWELHDGRSLVVTHRPMRDGWLTTYEDITDRRNADARLEHMAHYDALTDLPNRLLFHDRLERALTHARRGRGLALICLDLDHFKTINDTLGHPVGDALLQSVARRLLERARETDTVARLGGDEFAVIQTAVERPAEAAAFAARLLEAMETSFDIAGHQIVIGTSIGIAIAPQDGSDSAELLKNADLAMYRAKADGRGVFRLFQTEMDAEMQARRVMELDLRQALPAGQFKLFYQPLVELPAGRVTGFEALLRWHHPVRGLIAPAEFIPLSEEIGAIVPIGEWVLQQACLTAATWPGTLKVSVNLSAAQFKGQHNLVGMVADALHASGLSPERLELEITETVMLHDTVATLKTLHHLRELGVRIAMDDFGTGYSSLSYLRRFTFDRIKIDQSFIRELGHQPDCVAIVRAVIGLSQELGIATTAEGVETRDQLRLLAEAGCCTIQGYLFSPPVPHGDIAALLRGMPQVATLLEPGPKDDAWGPPALSAVA